MRIGTILVNNIFVRDESDIHHRCSKYGLFVFGNNLSSAFFALFSHVLSVMAFSTATLSTFVKGHASVYIFSSIYVCLYTYVYIYTVTWLNTSISFGNSILNLSFYFPFSPSNDSPPSLFSVVFLFHAL